MPVRRYILNRTGWAQVGAATLLVLLALGALWINPAAPVLGRGVGALLLALLALYMYLSYRWARQSGQADQDEEESAPWGLGRSLGVTLLGLGINLGVLVALVELTSLDPVLANLAGVLVATLSNFLGNKLYAFKSR